MRVNCVPLKHVPILTASSNIKSSSFAFTCAIRALNNATVKYRLFVEDGMSVEQEMTEESDPGHPNFFIIIQS